MWLWFHRTIWQASIANLHIPPAIRIVTRNLKSLSRCQKVSTGAAYLPIKLIHKFVGHKKLPPIMLMQRSLSWPTFKTKTILTLIVSSKLSMALLMTIKDYLINSKIILVIRCIYHFVSRDHKHAVVFKKIKRITCRQNIHKNEFDEIHLWLQKTEI